MFKPIAASGNTVLIDWCSVNHQDVEDDETENNVNQNSDAPVNRNMSEQIKN